MTPLTVREVGPAVIHEAAPSEALALGLAVPQSVSMGQAQLALHDAGLLVHVEAAIEALPEPARTRARIEWTKRPTVERNSPLVVQLGAAVGLNDAVLDALFIAAAKL